MCWMQEIDGKFWWQVKLRKNQVRALMTANIVGGATLRKEQVQKDYSVPRDRRCAWKSDEEPDMWQHAAIVERKCEAEAASTT
jgi:hypothetical protein